MSVTPIQCEEERKKVEAFLAAHFAPGAVPPFSFKYGGKSSSQFLKDWQFRQETKRLDDTKTEHLFTYTDPHTGLQVCCKCEVFLDFPAVEWVVTFKNGGTDDTPIIEDVQALDTRFTRKKGGEFILHRAEGSSATRMDFAPINNPMPPRSRIRLAPIGGRSSNTTAFPFFNIEAPGEGVMVGIGWSGQWAAELIRNSGTALTVRAGMELTHLLLHPDEQIRTPRLLLLFWQGDDRMRGHNMLRRFILLHRTPQKDGKPVMVPLTLSDPARFFDKANKGEVCNDTTEYNQIAFAERYRQLGLKAEYWWLDAGWFEGYWPNGVGNWFARKDGFPNGLRPLSNALKKLGMGFLLWFEPERVYRGTWLDRKHPEWILRLTGTPKGHRAGGSNRLLNLGNPEALQWLTDHISTMIESDGISIYRQDFNMDPLPYWRAADKPDRQGITEIRYIEGLYAFWDELLARHPGLLIDNCASGGRRIDLETTSRSIPLTRSDYENDPNGYQSHTYGLNFYIPVNATFHAFITMAIRFSWDIYRPNFPVEQAKHLIDEFKRLRPFLHGDFYPLTPYSIGDDVWMAYQFHREDLKQGMFLAFRRLNSSDLTARLKLRGLLPSARYELNFEDTGNKQTFAEEALAAGIDVTIEHAPGSLLVTYHECP
ncbi:MAG TPA: alpha-galactosidase [Dehalococcoidia bacterium]|nr:alpha-galactosidase [Dehalococcoidia bacterium]